MHKLFCLKKGLFLFGLSFSFFLLFNASVAKADFASCGITQTGLIWEVKNLAGVRVLAIDSAGNLDIVSTSVNIGVTPPASGLLDTFIIQKKSTGANIFSFSSASVYIAGSVTQLADQATIDNANGDDLLIKNSSGVNVARFDATGGNIYIAGSSCGTAIQISTCAELQNIQNDLSGNYVLTQNIDCSETLSWNGGLGFDPIGTFTGVFNGQGYAVQNLYINRPSEAYTGLFSQTNGADIKNVGLTSINIIGSAFIGGLVGWNSGSLITNSYSTGNVSSANNYVGGLVGYNYNSNIVNSYTAGSVSGSYSIGGLVGLNDASSSITNSYSNGSVDGDDAIGGLVGWNNGYSSITNSYFTGNVNGSSDTGGLVGFNNVSSITNSYSTGSVSGVSYVGGLIGQVINGTISNSYWNKDFAGTIGCGSGSCAGATGVTTNNMIIQSTYSGWTFQPPAGDTWKLSTITPSGRYYPCLAWQDNATCAIAPSTISSCAQLQNIQQNLSGNYALTQNIDCSATNPSDPGNAGSLWDNGGLGFDPINGSFTGVLDGKGYVIQNLYINRPTETYVGLFSQTNGAEIRNVGLTDININGGSLTGGLVGLNNGSPIANSYSTGNVSGGVDVGGLVGANTNNDISNSYSTCDVSGTGDGVGGLVGVNSQSVITDFYITNSYATGNVSGNLSAGDFVGGLVGLNNSSGNIVGSYSSGNVSGWNNVGGLVGQNNSTSNIESSYALGVVTGNNYIGGLAGFSGYSSAIINSYAYGNVSGNTRVGGLVGYVQDITAYNSSVTKSYATGNISGSNYVGGLVGGVRRSFVWSSYATGEVNGSDSKVAGLIGEINEGSASYSYSIGKVTGGVGSTGGIVGAIFSSSILNSYWNMETSGQTDGCSGDATCGGGAAGKTTAQMASEATYSGWDFEPPTGDTWKSSTITPVGRYYPCLAWQDDATCAVLSLTISTCAELQNIQNDLGGNYVLTQNIDCTETSTWNGGAGFDPIGDISSPFTGTFDGQGYEVQNLHIGEAIGSGVGLFGRASNAEFKNVGITNVNIYSSFDSVGVLVGYADDTIITGSYASGNLSGDGPAGGLVGNLGQSSISSIDNSYANVSIGRRYGPSGGLVGKAGSATSITNSYAAGTIEADGRAGGLVGESQGTITNSYATGSVDTNSFAGGLVGESQGTITNSYATGNVSGYTSAGGLAGEAYVINNSYATGNVTGDGDTGGLVGKARDTITNSYAIGNVTGGNQSGFGGLVGTLYGQVIGSYSTGMVSGASMVGGLAGDFSNGPISDSYSTGDVSGTIYVGGLIGKGGGTISNSYSTGDVSGGSLTGGFIGDYFYGSISNSYSTGDASGGYPTGGFIGTIGSAGSISNSYWNTDIAGTTGCGEGDCTGATGKTTDEMVLENTYSGWTFEPPTGDTWKLITTIPSEKYYPCLAWQDNATCSLALITISACAELQNIKNNLSGNYVLTQNIDCSETATWNPNGGGGYYGFDPIGDNITPTPFIGTFDGNGYAIQNLYINRSAKYYVGLFGYASGADIKNMGLTNININGSYYTGGLVGWNNNSSITNSYSTGSMSGGSSFVGGLVGVNYSGSSIVNSYSTGSVSGGSYYASGLAGYNYNSSITSSYSTGAVSGNSITGGLVGVNTSGGIITNSYSTSNVSGYDDTGGLVGVNYGSGLIANSYFSGNVTGTHFCAGGLAGGTNSISSITNSYSAGTVNVPSYRGALIGYYPSGSVSNSFWDSTLRSGDGCTQRVCYTGKTTAQMKTQSTFTDAGWDFTNTWGINPESYPCLQPYCPAQVFFDGFEVNNFASIWTSSSAFFRSATPDTGNYAIRVDGPTNNDVMVVNTAQDITPYANCSFTARLKISSTHDSGEYVCMDYSTDNGVTWNRNAGGDGGVGGLCQDGNIDAEGGFRTVDYYISSTSGISQFKYRFRHKASLGDEIADIDNVSITCTSAN